jgi:hypothetical protein
VCRAPTLRSGTSTGLKRSGHAPTLIPGSLILSDNKRLTSLRGLDNLKSVSRGRLHMDRPTAQHGQVDPFAPRGSPRLPSPASSPQIGGDLVLLSNMNLASVSGLRVGGGKRVRENGVSWGCLERHASAPALGSRAARAQHRH